MIDVKVTNPNEIKLAITIELPIGVWREIRKQVNEGKPTFYGPISDILDAIRNGINSIEQQAHIEEPKP